MNYQELYELADRELNLGQVDMAFMEQALEEAKGVKAHARQIYWRLRSAQIAEKANQASPNDKSLYVQEIRARLDAEDKGRQFRASLVGWAWAIACFAGLAGAFVFFKAARAAFIVGSHSYLGHTVSGIVCVMVGLVGYVLSRRDAGLDPFA